jgi:hypothetical protein
MKIDLFLCDRMNGADKLFRCVNYWDAHISQAK